MSRLITDRMAVYGGVSKCSCTPVVENDSAQPMHVRIERQLSSNTKTQ